MYCTYRQFLGRNTATTRDTVLLRGPHLCTHAFPCTRWCTNGRVNGTPFSDNTPLRRYHTPFCSNFVPLFHQVVYEWARGTPFADITQLTDVMEGSIVRAMVRLDQACRELQVGPWGGGMCGID